MRVSALVTVLLLATVGTVQADPGRTLFAVDGDTQTIVEFDAATGTMLGSLPTPGVASGGPDGLAASGSSLFFVNAIGANLIHEIDAETGVSLHAYPAPLLVGGTDGLAYAGGFLFTLDGAADTIFKVDPATGDVLGSCTTGMYAVGGLAGEGDRLFATLGLTSIVELDPDTCALLGGPFAVPSGDFAMGLAFDGTYLYAGTYLSQRIYTMAPDTGVVQDSFPAGMIVSGLAASEETVSGGTVTVTLDVKPGTCVNRLNLAGRGVTPAAVLGSAELDVSQIDPDSLRLEGVAPSRWAFEDVGGADCASDQPDGHLDMTLKFKTQKLVEALESRDVPMLDGMTVVVQMEGGLSDDTVLSGEDAVVIKSNPLKAEPDNGKSRHTERARRGRDGQISGGQDTTFGR